MKLSSCILLHNDCYRAGRTIQPRGVMVHSTGADNPWLSRYVAPDDGNLGENSNGNDWNRPGVGACVHAFIGQLADGSVATYQTLPWNWRGWHAGTGTTGFSANNTHISFEICEDGLDDPDYFAAVYQEAVELTAYLCQLYGLDPLEDGVVICHSEGYRRGVASNHADVMHWFPKFGKSMDSFRADVDKILKGEDTLTQEQFDAMLEDYLARRNARPASGWAAPYLQTAVDSGLMTGVDDGQGGKTVQAPQGFVSREELATVAAAISKKQGF